MSYAILRIAKLKAPQQIGRAATHNLRAHDTAAPHADPARRSRNLVEVGSADVAGVMAAVEARLASVPKFRKDAIRAVELVLTASPEFFATRSKADQNAWVEHSLAWLRDTWGAENIVSCVLHRDETTPHLQAIVVPIHDGRLRAAHWTDGPAKMVALQDSYAKAVEGLQLRRGQRGSKAQHVPLRAFYALAKRIAEAVHRVGVKHKPPRLPERGAFGRVTADDWARLEADLAKYGAEGLQLRAEAVAGRLIASSDVGQEAGRRAEAAKREREKAEAELAKVRVALAEAHRQQAAAEDGVRAQRQLMSDLAVQAAPLQASIERQRAEVARLNQVRREIEQSIQRIRASGAPPAPRDRDR
jgi:hypothetical protein